MTSITNSDIPDSLKQPIPYEKFYQSPCGAPGIDGSLETLFDDHSQNISLCFLIYISDR